MTMKTNAAVQLIMVARLNRTRRCKRRLRRQSSTNCVDKRHRPQTIIAAALLKPQIGHLVNPPLPLLSPVLPAQKLREPALHPHAAASDDLS